MIWATDVKRLYVTSYYDGFRAGWVEWQGKRYFATEVTDEEFLYELFDLTDEEWAHEDAQHAAFVEHVGSHNDYSNGRRQIGQVNKHSDPSLFWDNPQWRKRREYTNREPVAFWDQRSMQMADTADVRSLECSIDAAGSLLFEMEKYEDDDERYICLELESNDYNRRKMILLKAVIDRWLREHR